MSACGKTYPRLAALFDVSVAKKVYWVFNPESIATLILCYRAVMDWFCSFYKKGNKLVCKKKHFHWLSSLQKRVWSNKIRKTSYKKILLLFHTLFQYVVSYNVVNVQGSFNGSLSNKQKNQIMHQQHLTIKEVRQKCNMKCNLQIDLRTYVRTYFPLLYCKCICPFDKNSAKYPKFKFKESSGQNYTTSSCMIKCTPWTDKSPRQKYFS